MTDFLTVEDINSIVAEYYNVPFWDSVEISTGESTTDFTGVKFDYCTVDRGYTNGAYEFTIQADNDLWGFIDTDNDIIYNNIAYALDNNNEIISPTFTNDGIMTIISDTPNITVYFWLNNSSYIEGVSKHYNEIDIGYWITDVQTDQVNGLVLFNVELLDENISPTDIGTINCYLNDEDEPILAYYAEGIDAFVMYLPVTYSNHIGFIRVVDANNVNNFEVTVPIVLFKKLNVVALPNNLDLIVGRVNTFTLVSDSSNLSVESDYPVTIFDKNVTLDLSEVYDLTEIGLIVKTNEDNSYYPNEWKFKLETIYPTITTEEGLISLFSNGGIGKLGNNLTLTDNLTVSKDIYLVGGDYYINLKGYNIIISSDTIFKAENLTFYDGVYTIKQKQNSKVELSNCSFEDCSTWDSNFSLYGSVISCDVDLDSLVNPTDFITILIDCNFINCYPNMILHGGELNVENCNFQIDDKDVFRYIVDLKNNIPSFIYQTDGNATLLNNSFKIDCFNEAIEYDINFASCIFTIGENATVNDLDYETWQNNNISSFLNAPQNNRSSINLSYYYDFIEDYITLLSDNGFCHGVSGVDFVFKTNVQVSRRN